MTATRRRGGELEAAIFEATLDELAANGVAKTSMESIARSARTGKAALYRRWDSLDALIADALVYVLPSPDGVELKDDLRADLHTLLTLYSEIISSHDHAAFQVLKDAAVSDSSYRLCKGVIKTKVVDPLRALLLEVLDRGVERGDVRPGAATAETAQIGPAMMMYRCTVLGSPISDDFVTQIIDEIILPAVRTPRVR